MTLNYIHVSVTVIILRRVQQCKICFSVVVGAGMCMYTQLQKKPISHFSGAIADIRIRKCKYIYTIFRSNQFCIISLDNVTVLLKSVHAIRECLDKGSISK